MNYILLFLPLILGYLTNYFCNYSLLNKKTIIPKIYFSIIWPILYIIIGYIWSKQTKNNYINLKFGLILILNLLLCSWLIFNNCLKNNLLSFFILLLILLLSLYLCIFQNELLLIFLIIWILIVLLL